MVVNLGGLGGGATDKPLMQLSSILIESTGCRWTFDSVGFLFFLHECNFTFGVYFKICTTYKHMGQFTRKCRII